MISNVHLVSIGLAIQIAWTYAVILGSMQLFHPPSELLIFPLPENPLGIIVGIAFSLTLIVIGATDQKLLPFYTAQRTVPIAAVLASAGTLGIFAAYNADLTNAVFIFFTGAAAGIGSGLLLALWGTAFSRHRTGSIIVNSVIGITLAFIIYFVLLHLVPPPVSGIVVAVLPLIEIPFLWVHTPTSYALRNVKPIFDAIPLNKLLFSLQLAFSMLLLGFAFGMIRWTISQIAIPLGDPVMQLLGMVAGFLLSLSLFTLVQTFGKDDKWNNMFHVIIPLIAITMVFLPALVSRNSPASAFVAIVGCISFETLMWVTFGVIAQECRLSPFYLFGIGWGCLTLCSELSSLVIGNIVTPESIGMPSVSATLANIIILSLVGLVLAQSILPQVHDICRRTIYQRERAKALAREKEKEQAQGNEGATIGDGNGVNGVSAPASASSSGSALASAVNGGGASLKEETPATRREPDVSLAENGASRDSDDNSAARSPLHQPESSASQKDSVIQKPHTGSFRFRCEAVAKRYLLSARETQILCLLAKGYNATRIKDELCLSLSTAKTHINHIYHKLDIHTQQELIRMVDNVKE